MNVVICSHTAGRDGRRTAGRTAGRDGRRTAGRDGRRAARDGRAGTPHGGSGRTPHGSGRSGGGKKKKKKHQLSLLRIFLEQNVIFEKTQAYQRARPDPMWHRMYAPWFKDCAN